VTSDFGIGSVLDIEGNCRFYDLIRLRKICKISPKQLNGPRSEAENTWRMIPDPTLACTPDAFLGVI